MPRRKKQFKNLTGMPDILKKELSILQDIQKIVTSFANFYNFYQISTPILEEEELFIKGTGEETDIIQKETYSFSTQGKERVILRPEFTPSIVRAYIQNGMETAPKPVKLWSFGPLFRHEKPQKGRLRQFHQFNLEILGSKEAISDALLVQVFANILFEIGLENWKLHVNSIGCKNCRNTYIRKLKSHYKSKIKSICPECKKRIIKNPLRVLDCKEEKCQRVKKLAPQFVNYLCEECHLHFKSFLEFLDIMELPYILNPYLVRGLDYYEKTVFEFIPEGKEDMAQNSLIGGGRYDSLVENLGGRPTPCLGGAGGVERIMEELEENKIKISSNLLEKNITFKEKPVVFIVQLGDMAKKDSLKIIEDFKKAKIKIAENLEKDNLKNQLDRASRIGVKYALILGQQECLNKKVILRNMETGIQKILIQKDLIKEIKKKLKK
ncbi:MAG: histidine--tRNA ligase [Candidatus Pacebacteria bacterium]|nr:histidine--tRNA ligase [Candidatus Paceibacterota bacterium]